MSNIAVPIGTELGAPTSADGGEPSSPHSDFLNRLSTTEYTPSKSVEGMFAYEISFLRHELFGLKGRVSQLEIEKGTLRRELNDFQERMVLLEQENVQLKQRVAEDIPQKNALEETSHKISSLEKQVEETKTWAALFKNDGKAESSSPAQHSFVNSTIENVFSEQERRAKKALNIRVRGIPNGDKPIEEAKDLLLTKLSHNTNGFDTAWRSKFDSNVLFIKFRSLDSRNAALRLRAKLKGTFVFMDDDLTHTQWQARKLIIQEANTRNQRVVFIEGKPKFFAKISQ